METKEKESIYLFDVNQVGTSRYLKWVITKKPSDALKDYANTSKISLDKIVLSSGRVDYSSKTKEFKFGLDELISIISDTIIEKKEYEYINDNRIGMRLMNVNFSYIVIDIKVVYKESDIPGDSMASTEDIMTLTGLTPKIDTSPSPTSS